MDIAHNACIVKQKCHFYECTRQLVPAYPTGGLSVLY
jgi:hypothetical protein